jgi:acyl-CoA hydrolase
MLGHLKIQTDDDFSVLYKGKYYSSYDFSLIIGELADFDKIELLGRHGLSRTPDTKCLEVERDIAKIKSCPDEMLDTTGGNRGVCWWPVESIEMQEQELTTYFTVLPKHCNHHIPMIFGGEFMAQMDIAAAMLTAKLLVSSKTATHAVTHKFEGEFMAAAQMGDIVQLHCTVSELRKKAIVIMVEAHRQKRGEPMNDYIAWAKFIFVSKNEDKFVEHGLSL